MIKACNLKKRYSKTVALDDVSFEVKRGETFGLLGPNGAGKTTTIRLLCGLLKPDSGVVTVNGKTNPTLVEVRLSLGMVPQTLAIYEELSAEDNLRFFGRIYGLSGRRLKERVSNCLEIAGLTQRRKDKVSKYSGGMKRRLNMVCSLLHEPPLLLLDEPTVGVDPQSRNSIFDTIEAMKKQGRTIIYTTHYMEEAERICDRVAILDYGKILDMDSVRNLIAKHGGLSHIEAEFEKPPSDLDKIRQLVGNSNIQFEETKIRFETPRPMESLAMLNRSGIHLQSLKIQTANLEDVFLNLTGRRLRD
ncbi:MAG: ABC transporter ATP-binding protein [Phycisphaerae bacterium]|nr:ABC transporter ATP-binding protein [Phycisphaerae bacterium]MDD5380632.1 ABC transporter ATP-binding protein [Phycisphaerae bacterium]